MPSRASKKPKRDPVRSAFDTLQHIIETHDPEAVTPPAPEELKQAAATMSRAGAAKGGHARKAALSAKRRAEIARKAAAARWTRK